MYTLTHVEVNNLIDELEKETSLLPMEKDLYEKTLERYSHILHPSHHIMIDLEFTLVQLYGRQSLSPKQNISDSSTTGETCSTENNNR